jgi:hypothetical protein
MSLTKIEKLTPEQEARLVSYRAEWFSVGTCTDRANREKAETAIKAMYRRIGKPEPKHFLWCASPATSLLGLHVLKSGKLPELGASLRASLWASLWASLRDSLWASLGDSLRDSLWASLGDSLGDSLWASLGDSLGDSLRDSLGDSLRASLRDSLWASLGASLRASLRDSLWASLGASLRASLGASLGDSLANSWWGQHEAYWISFYLFCRDVLGIKYQDQKSADLDLWRDIAQSCCWWFPYENGCVISERPTVVKMEARPNLPERIHCADGPAIAFADGWQVFAWKGVRVTERIIMQPETITVAEVLAEKNAELRRILMERYDEKRFMEDCGAKILDSAIQPMPQSQGQDALNELLAIDLPGDPDGRLVMLRVIDPSTLRRYLLRVPPDMRTVRQALAWTFDVPEKEYVLAQES